MADPVVILCHGDEQAELYSDGEHVAYTMNGGIPYCSEHGNLRKDSNDSQCDHYGAFDNGGQPNVTIFEVDDLPSELLGDE